MKNVIVRASVLALAFVGFAASSVISHSQAKLAGTAIADTSVDCVPACLPSDPTHCGIGSRSQK